MNNLPENMPLTYSHTSPRGNTATGFRTQAEAEKAALAMDEAGCINCTDCTFCFNCVNCTQCADCRECSDCHFCKNLTNCSNCSNCKNCTSSTGLKWSNDCDNCHACDYCDGCNFCQQCTHCKKCNNCFRCENCFNCYHCCDCTQLNSCANCFYATKTTGCLKWTATRTTEYSSQILSLNGGPYNVSTDGKRIQVGCQNHTVQAWETISKELLYDTQEINAEALWETHKETIFELVQLQQKLAAPKGN
jgi:hypothetical protein